jgi:hypothetical protein
VWDPGGLGWRIKLPYKLNAWKCAEKRKEEGERKLETSLGT